MSKSCEQRLHFRGMSFWRAKSSLCRQPFKFLSRMRETRHVIRKQNNRHTFRQSARVSRESNLQATLLALLFCFGFVFQSFRPSFSVILPH